MKIQCHRWMSQGPFMIDWNKITPNIVLYKHVLKKTPTPKHYIIVWLDEAS